MGHLRQTCLGASPHQTLCIMPDYHQRPTVPTEECFIRKMPDELLCRTLEYLAPAQDSNGLWRYGPCLPIPLVCRRWEHLFSSISYRNIDFRDTPVKQLDATLRQRPELGVAVRGVLISINKPSDATCEMVANILRCCKGLRKFELDIEIWTRNIWIILNAAKRAPLATLELSGGPSLQMILKHFNLPTLKEVSLDFIGLNNGEEPGAASYHSPDTAYEDLKLLLSSTSPCNVTTMVLARPDTPAHVTRSFLQWPARLTSLTMESLHNKFTHETVAYTVEDIQGILDDHHHTLQHLSLGFLDGDTSLPDFSSLTSLDSLQIHGINLFNESPRRAASKWAPLLRYLGISLGTFENGDFNEESFAPDKICWFEDFFGHMTPGTNKLETVFVEDQVYKEGDWVEDDYWPWAYLDLAVGILAAHNVAMTYTQPLISREEFYREVERRTLRAARRHFKHR